MRGASPTSREDEVIAQDPAGGHAGRQGRRGDDHRLRGPGAGRGARRRRAGRRRDARRLLRGEGFERRRAARARPTAEDEDGEVLDQRPGAGVEVDEGRSVIVDRGPLRGAGRARPTRRTRRKPRREGRRPGRRPLERARGLAGLRARRCARASSRPATSRWPWRSPATARWSARRRAGHARAGRRAAGRDVVVPRAARPLRRGRHGAGAARDCSTCPTWAPGVLASAVCMDKVLFKDLMAPPGCRRSTTSRCARASDPASSAGSGCRCSSSPRGSDRRWGSRRSSAAAELPAALEDGVRARPAGDRRGDGRRAWRWSARCSATPSRRPPSRARS